MEMKGELKMESFVEFAENIGPDSVLLPLPRNGKTTSSQTQHSRDNIHSISVQKRHRSFDLIRESPSGKSIPRLTKSFSDHFIINIDKIITNVNVRSFEETRSILSTALSNEMSLTGNNNRVHDSSQKDNEMYKSSMVEIEDLDSCNWRKLHMEPTLPIYLKFEDVKYKVVVKGSEKESNRDKCILHGISGAVNPGEVLALMGPSGGGKTTLLNLLSGRVRNNSSGTITYNDKPYNKSLKRRIGFVLQDDIVFPHLTVKETLTYAALLRLPTSLTKDQKKERAMYVIGELGLERCQNTIIGGAFVRGISGGERKRVCIGNEILLNPSLLFLDEPTSGLDSTTALQIVQMLHNIAKVGKTVVATIHQPSSRLFTKFDNLILLGKGSTLYFGKPSEAMPYFSSIGCSPHIALNPAEFLIDLANGNIKDTSVPSKLEDKFLAVGCQNLETNGCGPSPGDVHEYLVGAHEARIANMKTTKHWKPLLINELGDNESIQSLANVSSSREWGAPWWEQFSVLFKRGIKERRHENLSSVRVIQVICTAVIVGLLWWHSDSSSPSGHHDQARLLFFISVFWAFFPLFTAIFTFPQERAMLVKERSVDMYKLSAYLVARNTSDLPLDLILPIFFLLIVYFMVGLKYSFLAFSFTLLTIFLSIVASQGLGLAIGAAFMEVKKATTFASITVMAFMLSGGFFIQNVPSFISWIRYISFNYHTYRLLIKIQYSCISTSLSSRESSSSCDYPNIINGERVGSGGTEVGAMLLMIIGYRILAYLFLRRMKLRTIL
ncbi:hypothetical protein LguiA_018322 [Lonicera macranthoides]